MVFLRITKRKLVLTVLCLILGGLAAYGETVYVRSVFKSAAYVPVAFAREDIPVNSLFSDSNVEFREIPEKAAVELMVRNPEFLKGKGAAREIKAGSPIFAADVSERRMPVMEEGTVRVTFETNLSDALAGAVWPGSIVNIGFTAKDGTEAKELFKGVQVVRITNKNGSDLKGEKPKNRNDYDVQSSIPATVTVILKPEEAVFLKRHEAMGRVFLMGTGLN